jgi:nucleotidyltransferase/DNA polymerase involved in DNA repair
MAYLIQEIFWYLVVAFILGAIIGWLVGRQGAKSKIAELEARIAGLQSNLAELQAGKIKGTPVETVEGIGTGFGKRLKADGIETTEQLLELCATDDGIRRVCQCVDLDDKTVRNWGTMADLIRIDGLGGQWAELMWRAGIRNVQDLARQDVEPLRARFREINEKEHRVAELPGENRVRKFIEQAGKLKPVLPD